MTEEKEVPETNGQENKEEENNAEDKTDLERDIIRQVEYYFGDINISRDKFLREQTLLDEGWVPLDVMLKFNRLAKLSTDVEFIAQTLLKSTSGLLEVSDDNKKVRRNPELPIPEMNEDRRKELASRTIYAKGFPKDAELDEVLKFFGQFEEVENVIMRRYQDRQTKKKLFKGSVFAMFKTKEQAQKFIELKDTKYGDSELLILWQQDYIDKKQEEYTARKQQKDKGKEKKEDTKADDKSREIIMATGACFKFSEGSDKMTREDIREALTTLGGEVAYIDFKVGDTEGWVRLAKENAAKELCEKFTDGKVKICDKDVVFKLLEGEEETAYLDKTKAEIINMKNRKKNNSRNRGRGSFRGRQNRKRRQDNDDGPPSKVKADS